MAPRGNEESSSSTRDRAPPRRDDGSKGDGGAKKKEKKPLTAAAEGREKANKPANQAPHRKAVRYTKRDDAAKDREENPELLRVQQHEFATFRPTGHRGHVVTRSGAARDRELTVIYMNSSPSDDVERLRAEVKTIEDFVTAWNGGEQAVNGFDTFYDFKTITHVVVQAGPHLSSFSLREPRHMTVHVAGEEQFREGVLKGVVHVYVGDSVTRPTYQGWNADYMDRITTRRLKGCIEAMDHVLDLTKSSASYKGKAPAAAAAAAADEQPENSTHEHHHHDHQQQQQQQHHHHHQNHGDDDKKPKAPVVVVDTELAAKLAKTKLDDKGKAPSSAVPVPAPAAAVDAAHAHALGYLVKDDTKFYWSESKKQHFFYKDGSGDHKSFFDFPAVSKPTKIARTLYKMPIYVTADGKFFYKDAAGKSHWLKTMKQGAPGS